MTITFPEINSADWEAMIGYLQPFATPPRNAKEILRVLPWYGKYQFTAGFEMCDQFLSKLSFDIEDLDNLGAHVDAAGAAYLHNLPATRELGKDFVKSIFRSRSARAALTPKMIAALVPAIMEEPAFWKRTALMIGPLSGSQDKETIITNPFFPDLFLRVLRSHDLEATVERKLVFLKVRKAGMPSVNGNYARIRNPRDEVMFVMKGQNPWDTDYCIQQYPNRASAKATWIIFSRQATGEPDLGQAGAQQNLYLCTVEFASKLPPRSGWRPYSHHIPPAAPFIKFD